MARPKSWTCRGCGKRWVGHAKKCSCGKAKPPRRRKKTALDQPYETWVETFGDICGICGREPSARRRLDRDHDHASGLARGLLCHRCNRMLPRDATADWMRAALLYLERPRVEFVEFDD